MKFISSTNDIRKYLGLKPKKDIKFLNIGVDEAIKIVISAGVIKNPETIQ